MSGGILARVAGAGDARGQWKNQPVCRRDLPLELFQQLAREMVVVLVPRQFRHEVGGVLGRRVLVRRQFVVARHQSRDLYVSARAASFEARAAQRSLRQTPAT